MSLIETPFGFSSTAAEVAEGIDLTGKRVVVTGAASGIGIETARALAGIGADVTLAVRDVEAGARAAADITATTGNDHVHVGRVDLADRASIARFVEDWTGPLHVLVNNAGVMRPPTLQHTPEGWELQFATNHLGHFALAHGLHGALAAAGDARIVVVSSSAHLTSPVVFDDPHFDFRPYDPGAAYGQSKTANVLFAVGATARWAEDGITANALMPGAISTNLQRYVDPDLVRQWRGGRDADDPTVPEGWKTPQQGAATSVLLATSPQLKRIGGRYFQDNQEAEVISAYTGQWSGVAPFALDPANAERLWEVSTRLLEV